MAGGGPVGVAVVGCGTISDQYLEHLTSFPDVRVLFCADLDIERAKAQAAKYGVPEAGTTAQALAAPDVEIVVNLTIPAAHVEVASAAIAAGKHVWAEKPLALETAAGRELLAAATAAGRQVGCAPDTLLGAGQQTARRLIAAGAIGTPLSAVAQLQGPGPESWHPDPAFLYARGAGPLFDMGPYYLSALASVLGPASGVAALGRRSRDQRVIGSGPLEGTSFEVEVPTYVAALISYADGAAATLVLSFDAPVRRYGLIEITGTEGIISLPDPNRFDGTTGLRTPAPDAATELESDWLPTPAEGVVAGRGLGVLDLARAIRSGGAPRASGELGLHALDIMESIARSAESGAFEPVTTTFTAPEPLAADWDPYAATL
jgi:predicted dehydrogenase